MRGHRFLVIRPDLRDSRAEMLEITLQVLTLSRRRARAYRLRGRALDLSDGGGYIESNVSGCDDGPGTKRMGDRL